MAERRARDPSAGLATVAARREVDEDPRSVDPDRREEPGPRAKTAATDRKTAPDLSVVVIASERPEPLSRLYEEIAPPLLQAGYECEFLFLVERHSLHLADPVRELAGEGHPIRVLDPGRARGETELLRRAVRLSRAPILLTLPAYARVVATSLPDLVRVVEEGADMAVARRCPRRDGWINRIQTRLFHAILRTVTSRGLDDVASGVRALRRDVALALPLYGDFARFFPVFAAREGFRVEQVDLPQHPRDRRTRLYSPGVYLRRLVDVLGLLFLTRFTYKPLRFFGLIGSGVGAGGAVILLVLFVQRIGGQAIANRPLLLLGTLLLTLGVQLVALGLVGEIVVHLEATDRRPYRVAEERPDGAVGERSHRVGEERGEEAT